MTLVVCRGEHFRGFWRLFFAELSPQEVFQYTIICSLIVNGIVTASIHALWRVLSNKIIWVLGHCWFDTPHIHIFEAHSVYQSCLLPNVTVTRSDSNYVNRLESASLKRLSWIIFSMNELVDRIRNFKSDASKNVYKEFLARNLHGRPDLYKK